MTVEDDFDRISRAWLDLMPDEASEGKPAPPSRSGGLASRVRRLARFLYRLLTETP